MPEIYGTSSLGQTVIIDEGFTATPQIRCGFLILNALLYIVPTIKVTMQYFRQRSSASAASKYHQKSMWLITGLFVAFVVNNTIRSLHVIDHHWRPVYYHEPKWIYQKYLITEMEIVTYANIFATTAGWIGIQKCLHAIQARSICGFRIGMCIFACYVVGSVASLGHYAIEPPGNYGPMPNFTIAGSAISTIPYFAIVAYIFWKGLGGDSEPSKRNEQFLQNGGD